MPQANQALDPAVLDRLSNLALVARTVVEGFMAGQHRSARLGSSVEFAQHREYVPGDELKRVDWKVFARSDRLVVKQYDGLNEMVLDHHPFDVVGWDGYFYPWAFNIRDFEPIVGRVHQPPPVHQTFEGDGFVVCSFCPRPYDFDPNAVPAPYNHSNVD